ncbi:hypothetical protein [Streptomyces griseorubiginosus]|uniref:hypothetical protein n=1 Tax=Streptomyces griseorubiginosus TaxID=67304 RepID=UPI0036DFA9D0
MEMDNCDDCSEAAALAKKTGPSGGIYALPGVGKAATGARQFYDEMAPLATDSTRVRAAKEVFRWGSAAVGMAAVAIITL